VLAALAALPTDRVADPAAAEAARSATLAYLRARRDQIDYARFRRLGLPIGSGMVESAHTTVVQQRLKGAGMHWARPSVDTMLALRCAACNDRWAELWPSVVAGLRARARPARPCAPRVLSAHQASRPARRPRPARPRAAPQPRREPAAVAGRPTAAHPWKKAAARTVARKAARSARSARS
jgi:hypothetical protein